MLGEKIFYMIPCMTRQYEKAAWFSKDKSIEPATISSEIALKYEELFRTKVGHKQYFCAISEIPYDSEFAGEQDECRFLCFHATFLCHNFPSLLRSNLLSAPPPLTALGLGVGGWLARRGHHLTDPVASCAGRERKSGGRISWLLL